MRILVEELGDSLALPSAYPNASHELPSPELLRHKILVKCKLTTAAAQSTSSSKGVARLLLLASPSHLLYPFPSPLPACVPASLLPPVPLPLCPLHSPPPLFPSVP